jgi:hypothetical protein
MHYYNQKLFCLIGFAISLFVATSARCDYVVNLDFAKAKIINPGDNEHIVFPDGTDFYCQDCTIVGNQMRAGPFIEQMVSDLLQGNPYYNIASISFDVTTSGTQCNLNGCGTVSIKGGYEDPNGGPETPVNFDTTLTSLTTQHISFSEPVLNLHNDGISLLYIYGATDGYIGLSNFTMTVHGDAINVGIAPIGGVNVGSTVLLDGSSSSAESELPLSYSWQVLSGPTGFTLGNANQEIANFSSSAPGDYVVQLTVSDGNLTQSGTQSFTVVPSIGFSVSVSIDTPNPTLGDNLQLASHISGGAAPYVYAWSVATNVDGNSDKIVRSADASKQDIVYFAPFVIGDYVVKLDIKDANGNTASVSKSIHMTPVACGIGGAPNRIPQGYLVRQKPPKKNYHTGVLYAENTFNPKGVSVSGQKVMGASGCNIASTMMVMNYFNESAFAIPQRETVETSQTLYDEWDGYRVWAASHSAIPRNNEITWEAIPKYYNDLCASAGNNSCSSHPNINYLTYYFDTTLNKVIPNINIANDRVFQELSTGQKFSIVKKFVCGAGASPLLIRVPELNAQTPDGHSVVATGLTTNSSGVITATIMDPSYYNYQTLDNSRTKNEIDGIRPIVSGGGASGGGYLYVAVSGDVNISAGTTRDIERKLSFRKKEEGSGGFVYRDDSATDPLDPTAFEKLQTLVLSDPPAGDYTFLITSNSSRVDNLPNPYTLTVQQFDASGVLTSVRQSSGNATVFPISVPYTAPVQALYGNIDSASVILNFGAAPGMDSFSIKGKLNSIGNVPNYEIESQNVVVNIPQFDLYLEIPAGGFVQVGNSFLYTNTAQSSGIKSMSVSADGSIQIDGSGLDILATGQGSPGVFQVQIGPTMFAGVPSGNSLGNDLIQITTDAVVHSIGEQAQAAIKISSELKNSDNEYVIEASMNDQPVVVQKNGKLTYSYLSNTLSSTGLQKFSVSLFVQDSKKAKDLLSAISSIKSDIARTEEAISHEIDQNIVFKLRERIASDNREVNALLVRLHSLKTKIGNDVSLYYRII